MSDFILNNENSEFDLGILSFIKKVNNNEPIKFTTSGTTSEPKSVIHTVESLTKNIKISNDLKNSVWGLTFDYTKMAGSQVILQSYLNGGKVVNLFNKSHSEIIKLINKFKVTHISATPTFYRLLVGREVFKNVKQITSSGEIIDDMLVEKIKNTFINANFTNIYALTEFGTVFASKYSYFEIGKKYESFIKIENNHIFIKKNDYWFDTGDVVEMINFNKFKIIGRENNMINVGGIKVNPIKIENIINTLFYVKNSYVYGRSNSILGNVVVADIMLNCDISIKTIKSDLSKLLNSYELPLKINIVDNIKINSTGKIIRK